MSNYDTRVNPDLYSIAPPTSFLSLAPTTSSSYPSNRHTSSISSTSTAAAAPSSPVVKKAESVVSEGESAVVEDVSIENAATIIEGMKRDRQIGRASCRERVF